MRLLGLALLLACRSPHERPRDDLPRPSSVAAATTMDATSADALPQARPFELMPCRPTVLGHTFRGAVILCLAFQAASITSIALDDPARRIDAITAVDSLVEQALAPEARAGFPSNSVLYQGLVALMLAGLESLSPNNAS